MSSAEARISLLYISHTEAWLSRFLSCVSHHLYLDHFLIVVLQYLGIPLVAGVATRYTVWHFTSKAFLDGSFLARFSPLSFVGFLYTIFVMFANQGHHILHNIGSVFRVLVPMILYFVTMWSSAFALVYYLTRRSTKEEQHFGYDMAVVQAFTAGSNNFVRERDVQHNLSIQLTIYFLFSYIGTCYRSRHCDLRHTFGPSARRDYWPSCRGSSPTRTYMGSIMAGRQVGLERGRREPGKEHYKRGVNAWTLKERYPLDNPATHLWKASPKYFH